MGHAKEPKAVAVARELLRRLGPDADEYYEERREQPRREERPPPRRG